MKRLIAWLERIFSSREDTGATDQPRNAADNVFEDSEQAGGSLGAKVVRWMDTQEPKEVPMPDIYSEENAPTVPDLEVIDESTADSDKPTEFDPYDTAKLHKK